jgi:hypothetical protein
VVLTEMVQVALGAPPVAVADVIEGAVPPVLLGLKEKLLVVTPLTGSLKVAVQVSGPVFVGLVPAMFKEFSVGAVVS